MLNTGRVVTAGGTLALSFVHGHGAPASAFPVVALDGGKFTRALQRADQSFRHVRQGRDR